jgi:Putative beta-barrel porin 2
VRKLCRTGSFAAHLPRRRRLRAFEVTAIVVLAMWNAQVCAAINFGGEATAKYEYNSNIFDLPAGFAVGGVASSKRDDWYQAYGGTLQASDLWDQNRLYATLTGKQFHYDYFTALNHTEYSFDGGLAWKAGADLDGKFDVTRSHSMVPFTNLLQTQISLSTDQRETAQIGWHFIPDWRVQGVGYYHTDDQPLVGSPDLKLAEKSGQLTLQYLGRAGLVAGISGTYVKGNYTGSNTTANPDYDQKALQLVATYQVTGRSSFEGQVGYSRRTSTSLVDNTSGLTGKLAYRNQLTPKTSVNVSVERNIDSYITNSGSEINTSAATGVTWQATYKLAVTANYVYTRSVLPNQGNTPDTNRIDHLQFFNLKLDYQPLRWLWIQPYVNVQTRSSNFAGAAFNASVYGVSFDVLWHCPTNRCT